MALLLLISIFSLTYGVQALADLKGLYQNSPDALKAELILSPRPMTSSVMLDDTTLLAAQEVVDQRLENLHLAGTYTVTPQGEQLLVKLPQSENMPYITSVLSSIGEIEFINGGSESPPIGRTVKTATQAPAKPDQNIYQTLFTAQDIESVTPPDSATGQIFYQLTLRPAAVERLGGFIEKPGSDYICMVMDEQVLNCSMMYHWLGNTVEILPGLSSGTVISLADLGIFLNSGPLPILLQVEMR
jgi:preprotein translocase subunit SecD